MTTPIIVLTALTLALGGGFAWYLGWSQKRILMLELQLKSQSTPAPVGTNPLVLGAYERLALYAERSKLTNLVNRLHNNEMSAQAMQQTILQALRDEYEHNTTQQLYVAPQIWDAITRMKDQNAYIVNQVAELLPNTAAAIDLSKNLIQFAAENPDATLNAMILTAIQGEAKKAL
ncbi:MAG: hypothetical protein EAY75_09105 [Bacteroidetes bacterium]|nr:MAG: hypothetical protein EAY75_09105 [Bacteroidota bacterium]